MSTNDALRRKRGDFRTLASLSPGQKGTIRMFEQYGDDLFCVRYRYNRKLGIRIKTVELIVDVKKL